jgi:hypothetical protein
MAYLRESESGEISNLKDLEGLEAKVFLPVKKGSSGKIVVSTEEQTIELVAVVAEESTREEFKCGERVTIVKIENGVAHVASEDFIG